MSKDLMLIQCANEVFSLLNVNSLQRIANYKDPNFNVIPGDFCNVDE